LLVGSNKPNVGHGEAVSGLTSIIKATLALENKLIPPTTGIQTLSPDLKLAERNIGIVQHLTPWPQNSIERISVNAFGYGGANAHVIIDSAAMHVVVSERSSSEGNQTCRSVLLPFSAHHQHSLAKIMEGVTKMNLRACELSDLAYTLAVR
jgi:acyl transferase domain-containing protein